MATAVRDACDDANLDRTYFIVAYEVRTTNFIKVSHKRSIAFLFDKNSLRILNDIKRHEM